MATFGIIVDVIVIAVLLLHAIFGLKKGLLKSIIGLCSWFVCIAVAIFSAKYVAIALNKIYNFDGLIGGKIAKALVNKNEFFATPATGYVSDNIPDGLGFLGKLTNMVFSKISGNFEEGETIATVMGNSLGHVCMLIISAVVVFILLRILIMFVNKFIDKITKAKVVGGVDKTLGLVLGIVKGCLIILIINAILAFLSLVPFINKLLETVIQQHTYVEKFIFNFTDKFIEDKVINGGLLQKWLSSLWANK